MSEDPALDHDLLVRIDERVKQAMTTMEQRDIYHRAEMERFNKLFLDVVASFTTTLGTMSNNFASKVEMSSVRHDVGRLERTVYGAAGVILLAFIGALIAMVIKSGHVP